MYKPQRKSLGIIIGFLIALLAFAIVYMAIFDIQGLRSEIKDLKVELSANKEMLRNQNFDLHTLSITNQSLRLDIVDRDLEIIELKVNEMVYEDMVSIYDYCLSYIFVMQQRMDNHGISYPEFIVERIMLEILAEGIEE